jgi:flagella basal body P-ring formation protein FlgA
VPDGRHTIKALAPGEAITARNTASTPMVGRGEWVLLRLKSGLVELESRVQAMQQGDLGQTVQVRSSGGSAPLAARVIARGQVEAML